jgi:hypothetical protein
MSEELADKRRDGAVEHHGGTCQRLWWCRRRAVCAAGVGARCAPRRELRQSSPGKP